MSLNVFKLAAGIEGLLVVVETCLHPAWLPLGGGHAQQLGVVFGAAYAVSEICDAVGRR
jgi:hypothetical protein